MPRLRPVALALAVPAALALGACDGDTAEKNDYVDEVNAVTTTLNRVLAEVSSETAAATSVEQTAGKFSDFASSLGTAASDVDAITPPDDVSELHEQLVADLEALRDEAANAANEAEAGGPASVPGVSAQFLDEAIRLSGEIDATISEINTELQG